MKKHGAKTQYYLIHDSGHNMHWDNPAQLAHEMINDIFNERAEGENENGPFNENKEHHAHEGDVGVPEIPKLDLSAIE